MRTLVALLLVASALAGCAGSDDSTTTDQPTTPGTKTTSKNPGTTTTGGTATTTTTTSPSGGNQAPTGTVAATVPGGSLPMNVTFAISGDDADGDALAWALDADQDGTADREGLEASKFSNSTYFVYAANGLYNVTFTLGDGKTTTTYHLLVNVTSAAGQTATGAWEITNPNCLGATSTQGPATAYFPSPLVNVNHISVALDAASKGRPYNVTYDLGGGAGIPGLWFATDTGAYIERHIDTDDKLFIAGLVPATAATVYIFSCTNEPDSNAATLTVY